MFAHHTLWFLLVLLPVSTVAEAGDVSTIRMSNGLTVLVSPVSGADEMALIVLYDIGSDHDPSAQSGLAHFMEHMYVTAAAGDTPARSVAGFVKQYPAGWNAQTVPDATIFATVFPRHRLEQELADAAARMGKLRIAQEDVDRERPRILDELENMHARVPELAALNAARDRARPVCSEGRRGGVTSTIKRMKLEMLHLRWLKYYKPRNATVVLAGDVDAEVVRPIMYKHFSKLPAGLAIGKTPPPPPGRLGQIDHIVVDPQPGIVGSCVAVSMAAPMPGDERYPAFLVLVARMWSKSPMNPTDRGTTPVARFTPLDDPTTLTITAPLAAGETPEQGIDRINELMAQTTNPEITAADRTYAQVTYGALLGFVDQPDRIRAQNLYGVALAAGRCHQLGIDTDKLGSAIGSVTPEAFRHAADTLLSPKMRATVIVTHEGG